MLYGLSDEMWDVGNVVCYGSDILRVWDLGDVRYSGCGIFRMWDVSDVECSGCGMWDVGRLPGCRMLIYKMPHKGISNENNKGKM